MYSKIMKSMVLSLGLSLSGALFAEVVIIVNPAKNVEIDKATIKKIFMGRAKSFADGSKAVPVDLDGGEVKKTFLKDYLQKDQSAVDSYWSRMIFTGAATPPRSFANAKELRAYVSSDVNAIGYIDSQFVDASVKVVDVH
jgi:ABC-type phosphate transport system substrate-binding protein